MRDPGGFLHEPANRAGRHKKPAWTKIRANTDECYAEVVDALRRTGEEPAITVEDNLATRAEDDAEIEKSGHRTGASCGELMAATAFCVKEPKKTLAGQNTKDKSLGKHSGWVLVVFPAGLSTASNCSDIERGIRHAVFGELADRRTTRVTLTIPNKTSVL
ncbi:hypothetical protein Q7P36_007833 [Cladosporium allicinum]